MGIARQMPFYSPKNMDILSLNIKWIKKHLIISKQFVAISLSKAGLLGGNKWKSDKSKDAMEAANGILEALEGLDFTGILGWVSKMSKISVCQVSTPQPIVDKLLEFFSHRTLAKCDVGFQMVVAKQMKRLTEAMYFVNTRKENPVACAKEEKTSICEAIDEILGNVDETSSPTDMLRYELECARASTCMRGSCDLRTEIC